MSLKYYAEWEDRLLAVHRVELWVDAVVTSQPVQVLACTEELPKMDVVSEDCCMGTGLILDIVSPSRLSFLASLYTNNPKGIKLVHLINGVVSFTGWVNPEQYDDRIGERLNYPFSITANNGFAALERILYLQSNGAPITGITSCFNVLRTALLKIGLSYNSIFVSLALKTDVWNLVPTEQVGATNTPLHVTYTNPTNYYDEKGIAMNCREVLNAVLSVFGAKMFIWENSIYILDLNQLSLNDLPLKQFQFATGAYVATVNVPNLVTLDELLNGAEGVSMSSGRNSVELTSSLYAFQNPMTFTPDGKKFTGPAGTSNYSGGKYTDARYYAGNTPGIQMPMDANHLYVQSTKIEDGSVESFLRVIPTIPVPVAGGFYTGAHDLKIDTGTVIADALATMNISMEMMLERLGLTTENYYGTEGEPNPWIISLKFYFKIRVGDKEYNATAKKWQAFSETANWNNYYVDTIWKYNKWQNMDIGFYYDGPTVSGGAIRRKMFVYPTGDAYGNGIVGGPVTLYFAFPKQDGNTPGMYTYRLKDLKINYKYLEQSVSGDDPVRIGYLDPLYKDNFELSLLHGSGANTARPLLRGSLLSLYSGVYYSDMWGFRRLNQSDGTSMNPTPIYKLESLLLNSIMSNFKESRFVFSCTVQSLPKHFNTFKYSLLQRDGTPVRMMLVGGLLDHVNNMNELTLGEFVPDDLTIEYTTTL